MMYALVAPVFVFGGGAAIDYGRAAQIHTKLNAAADAAALAALTPAMLQQSSQTAHDASVSMFNGLTEGIPGLTPNAMKVTVTVTVGGHGPHTQRLSQLLELGQHHLRPSVGQERVGGFGHLASECAGPAQYRLLRPARQLALDGAASDAGRHHQNAKLDHAAKSPGGCAFACHHESTNTNSDTKGNPCVDGTTPTLSAPRRRRRRATPIARPRTAGRSITTSSPATTASLSVWTS